MPQLINKTKAQKVHLKKDLTLEEYKLQRKVEKFYFETI
jgi:hypothetical protein